MSKKKLPMRTIKSAPKEGKIPRDRITAAVKKVAAQNLGNFEKEADEAFLIRAQIDRDLTSI